MSTRKASICKHPHVTNRLSHLHVKYAVGNPTQHIPRRHLRNRKPWTIISLFLELQPNMKNWIYRHPTGVLNYTRVHTKTVIVLGLPNAPPTKHLSKLLTFILSAVTTGLQSYGDTCYAKGGRVVWIRCGFWRTFRVHTIKFPLLLQ